MDYLGRLSELFLLARKKLNNHTVLDVTYL